MKLIAAYLSEMFSIFPACKTQIDLGFIIDGSGSVEMYGKGNFQKCLDFVKSLTRAFVISPTDTRVGVIEFSSRSELQFDFREYTTQTDVERAIDGIKYPGYRTNAGQALTMAKDKLFNDARAGVPRVLVVLTDGRSHDDVVKPSEELRNVGVIIFAVGLGRNYNLAQLNAMATKDNVFTADFPDMMTIITKMQEKLCKGKVLLGASTRQPFTRVWDTSPRSSECQTHSFIIMI